MKTYKLLISLILLPMFNYGQEYCFPLYFEDAAGNKDTLYFGFDKNATTGIDSAMGEVNIIGEPYDSSLFAFFTNATSYEKDYCLEFVKDPTFVSKHQIINNSYYPIEIGIIARNWPITISWNESEIKGWDINNFFNFEKPQLIMTCANPPGGWFDALCCGGKWPNFYTPMADTGQFSIDKEIACHYKAIYTNDSISLLFIGIESTTVKIENFDQGNIHFLYDHECKTLSIQNYGIAKKTDLILSDLSGKTIFNKRIELSPGFKTISMNAIPSGLYIITICDHENNKILKSQKIYMQ